MGLLCCLGGAPGPAEHTDNSKANPLEDGRQGLPPVAAASPSALAATAGAEPSPFKGPPVPPEQPGVVTPTSTPVLTPGTGNGLAQEFSNELSPPVGSADRPNSQLLSASGDGGIPASVRPLSPYHLQNELGLLTYLGQGACGVVYLGNSASMGPVAIKFMICVTPQVSGGPWARQPMHAHAMRDRSSWEWNATAVSRHLPD